MIEKGTIMESEAEPSSKELLKIYDTALAEKLMQKLLPMIENCAKQTRSEKVVVAVSGGSGSGKTVTALLLSCFLKEKGIENYILSGDAYPHRIPKYNDAERLQIFRENAIVGMLKEQTYTEERCTIIQEFQKAGNDADEKHVGKYPWYESYLRNGRRALENYLGTEKEINFEEVNRLVHAFKAGGEKLWVRHMGREETELWYEEKDFTGIKVLLVEWTHSNSEYYSGVDIPIYLDSTPQETLQSRLERNRDQWIDNPFTMMVLDIEQKKLMDTVSFVFQDSKLLKMSIYDNVRMGKKDATRVEVMEALKNAQCEDIIEKLPNGIDTVIGSKGTYLSGGEAQRVSIARAMLKNAPILILDEATAFADPDNEVKVQAAFAKLSKGKTVIMIAHRLSSVTGVDRIFVLQDGEIRQAGKHEELKDAEGLYAHMWKAYNQSVSWKVGV